MRNYMFVLWKCKVFILYICLYVGFCVLIARCLARYTCHGSRLRGVGRGHLWLSTDIVHMHGARSHLVRDLIIFCLYGLVQSVVLAFHYFICWDSLILLYRCDPQTLLWYESTCDSDSAQLTVIQVKTVIQTNSVITSPSDKLIQEYKKRSTG